MITNTLQNQTDNHFKTGFIKADSEIDILKANLRFSGKVVIDVGCGTGKISRLIASEGAQVVGIDTPELIGLAKEPGVAGNVVFKTGTGQNLPVENNFADIIIYYASFHHVPEIEMNNALKECSRVLKENGLVFICEPLTDKGSYYDLASLIEDEKEIREIAHAYISLAGETNFHMMTEKYYYIERTFEDFINLANVYVTDFNEKGNIIRKALEIVLKSNKDIDNARFRSLARLNILQKNVFLRPGGFVL